MHCLNCNLELMKEQSKHNTDFDLYYCDYCLDYFIKPKTKDYIIPFLKINPSDLQRAIKYRIFEKKYDSKKS